MEPLYLSIAGFIIKLEFKESDLEGVKKEVFQNFLKREFKDFIINVASKVDFTIEIYQRLDFEFFFKTDEQKSYLLLYQVISPRKAITFYYVTYQQVQLIIRNICQLLLAKNNGVILHASACLVKGKAHLFLGKSGAGKSTTVRLLFRDFLPLADDMVILKKENKQFFFYQTPFIEKNLIFKKTFKSFPVGGVYFVKKSNTYSIDKIHQKHIISKMFVNQLFTEYADKSAQVKYLLDFLDNFDNFNYLSFSLADPKKLIDLFKNLD